MSFILRTVIQFFSKMPLTWLYGFSNFLFFLQHHFIQYRKDLVLNNLGYSFPEKNQKEINAIYRKFNQNLCDYPIESIKSLTISHQELDKRMSFENLELLNEIQQRGQNVMLVCGHFFNWEWLIGLSPHLPTQHNFAIYHKIKNKSVSKTINQARERFGTETIIMKEAARKVMKVPNDGNATFLMIADQRPHSSQIHYDLDFLNRNAPVFVGFDKLAVKQNMAVVYVEILRKGRGKYHYCLHEILPENQKFRPYEITHQYFDLITQNIKKDPSNWLWTHNRWKYKKGKDY